MSTLIPGSECVGRVVEGRFRLLHWLGGTEHSSVYLTLIAGDPPRSAATKFLAANGEDAEASTKQWTAAETLSHPHLVRLFHFGRCEIDSNTLLYTVSEYAEEVLAEVLAERPLSAAETAEMLPAIVDALGYLHARGLVHGGLTPSNILVVEDHLKLSVDGLQTAGEPLRRARLPNEYDAPEVTTEKMSPAMDVWSLGVVLVKALSQEMPAWNRWIGGEPVVPDNLPEPFAGIVQDCLRVDPSRRCTVADIKARLAPSIAAKPADKGAGTVHSKRLIGPRTRIALAVMLVAGVAIAAVEMRSHRTQSAPAAVTQNSASSPAESEAQPPDEEALAVKGPLIKGSVTDQVMPEAPEAAMETIHGHFKVGIRVEVDAGGNVSNATIDAQGPSRYFADFALKAGRGWKFRPAAKNGRAVASTWMLHFMFGQSGVEVTPVETAP
ncbi:MAG: protein kinase [Terracidiphilus sp.]